MALFFSTAQPMSAIAVARPQRMTLKLLLFLLLPGFAGEVSA